MANKVILTEEEGDLLADMLHQEVKNRRRNEGMHREALRLLNKIRRAQIIEFQDS